MKLTSLWLLPLFIAGVSHATTANNIDPSDPRIWQEKTAPVRTHTQASCTSLSTTEHCYVQDPATMTDIQRESLRRQEKREINKWEDAANK